MKDFKGWKDIEGWLFDEEAQLLQKYARDVNVIELGSYCGKSTVAMAAVAKTVYAVDTFDGRATTSQKPTWDEFINNLEACGVFNVIPKKGTTENEVIGAFATTGLLFIDAEHTYEAVKRDFDLYYPKVVTGGFIILHDSYGENGEEVATPWPGVTKFTKELYNDERVKFIEKCRRCSVFQKL